LKDTAAYITRRILIAGGEGATLFTREAVELIHLCSHGIPRTISVICDNALMSGFAADQRPIGYELVHEVCRDFDLNPPLKPVPAPAAARPVAAGVAPAAPPQPRPKRVTVESESKKAESGAAASGSLFSVFSRPRRFSFF
jgi:hypothetical protein